MSIPRLLILAVVALSGCAGPDGASWPALSLPWPAASGVGRSAEEGRASPLGAANPHGQEAVFSFDWQLAGDARIMPVQVFDDGSRMWLQFGPEGAWPAVFHVDVRGWRPLRYRSEGAYMVLDGVYDRLELRGGHLRGSIQRVRPGLPQVSAQTVEKGGQGAQTDPTEEGMPGFQAGPVETVGLVVSPSPVPVDAGHDSSSAPRGGVHAGPAERAEGVHARASAATGVVDVAAPGTAVHAGMPASADPSETLYSAGPADVTMRQALERWATTAGWTFSAEHWAVDVDIPLVGQANFQADFRSAVRELLAATEMGDRALQPCFYSNRVLRVVPYAQACDRRRGMGAMS